MRHISDALAAAVDRQRIIKHAHPELWKWAYWPETDQVATRPESHHDELLEELGVPVNNYDWWGGTFYYTDNGLIRFKISYVPMGEWGNGKIFISNEDRYPELTGRIKKKIKEKLGRHWSEEFEF